MEWVKSVVDGRKKKRKALHIYYLTPYINLKEEQPRLNASQKKRRKAKKKEEGTTYLPFDTIHKLKGGTTSDYSEYSGPCMNGFPGGGRIYSTCTYSLMWVSGCGHVKFSIYTGKM